MHKLVSLVQCGNIRTEEVAGVNEALKCLGGIFKPKLVVIQTLSIRVA